MTIGPHEVGQRTLPVRPQQVSAALCGGAVALGLYLVWSRLGASALSTDEQYSAVEARLPLAMMWSELARTDTHPPLDYLVRSLVVGRGDAFWMRVPSALAATGSLGFVWWWMRRRGWFGCAVIAISSVFPFFLLYGRTARMYAFLVLFGLLVAWLSEAWMRHPDDRLASALFGVLVLALFTDNTSVLLAGGAFTLAGLRRDRHAWAWRAASIASLLLWAAVWGRNIPSQLRSGGVSWIPYTTPGGASDQVGRVISLVHPEMGLLVLVTMVAGGWCLRHQDRHLGRVVVCLRALPAVMTVVAGVWAHVLLARSLAVSAGCAVLAVAGAVEQARRTNVRVLAAAVAVIMVLIVPSIGPARAFEEEAGPAMRALSARSQAGDVVVLSPANLHYLFQWSLGAPARSLAVSGLDGDGVQVHRRPGAPASGRTWVLAHVNRPWEPEGWRRCPGERSPELVDYTLRCYLRDGP